MKRNLFIIVSLIVVFVFSGCGQSLREEVVSSYDNGQPAKAYYYNKGNQWVYEKDFYDTGILMMEGPILNGQREGDWISYFPDGKVQSTGVYKEGLRIGKSMVYHQNGRLWMDGWYVNDHKCGEWIFYDEQGYELERKDFGPCD